MIKKVNVLDKGYVELQDILGDDISIVNAARVSYLSDSKGSVRDCELIHKLMANGHGTPFEHVVFRFRIKAPEMVLRQWVRHRIGSFNVQSRRYTEVEDEDFYTPDVWRGVPHGNQKDGYGREELYMWELLGETYDNAMWRYKEALKEGIPREQARLFLPGFAVYSTFIWTVNARSLMNFLKQRLSEHAQWEIRQYANVIWEIFKEQLPWTAKAFQFYVLDYEASCEDATTKAVVMRDAIEEFVRVFELDKGWLNEGDGEKYCAILDRYQIVAYEKDNPEEYKVLRRFLEILENIE